MTDEHQWTLTLHPEPVAIVRLEPGSELPDWARPAGPLTSVYVRDPDGNLVEVAVRG